MGGRSINLPPQQNVQHQHLIQGAQPHLQHERHDENGIHQQSQSLPIQATSANQVHHNMPGLGVVPNGMHRPLVSEARVNSDNRNNTSLAAQLAGNVPPTIGRSSIALPEGSTKPANYTGPGTSGNINTSNPLNQESNSNLNGSTDIGGYRQSPPRGISGQGLFAGRNVVGESGLNVNNNSVNHNSNENNSNTNNNHHSVSNSSLVGQPRGSPNNSQNVGITTVNMENSKAQQAQQIDPHVHNVNPGKGDPANASFSVDGSKPLQHPATSNRLEMMPNFGSGDGIFDNGGGSSNGDVTGPGNIDSGLFFDDGDLAATTSGGDLEF